MEIMIKEITKKQGLHNYSISLNKNSITKMRGDSYSWETDIEQARRQGHDSTVLNRLNQNKTVVKPLK